jgi:hypothetical protein
VGGERKGKGKRRYIMHKKKGEGKKGRRGGRDVGNKTREDKREREKRERKRERERERERERGMLSFCCMSCCAFVFVLFLFCVLNACVCYIHTYCQ